MSKQERIEAAVEFLCPHCGQEESLVVRTVQGAVVDGEPGVRRVRECISCGKSFETQQDSPGDCSQCGSRWFEVTKTRSNAKYIYRRHRCVRCFRGRTSTHETVFSASSGENERSDEPF